MTVDELKKQYTAILEAAKTEKRSLKETEIADLDRIKSEIEAATKQAANADAAAKQIADREAQLRSIAAAQTTIKENLGTLDKNTYLRSIAKGSADVGNKEVVSDVVRAFESQSPIFAAHKNVQNRSTGNAFSFTKVTQGAGAAGYIKVEGVAGTEDTTSAVTVQSVAFKLYDSQRIAVSQEMLDDAAADIAAEIIGLGSAKSTMKFDTDCVTKLASAFGTIPETAGTTWAVADLIAAYLEIPNRNRYEVSYVCNGSTAAALLALFTTENAPALAAIGFSKDTLVIDSNVAANTLIVGNVTLALALGMKTPVRIFTQESSAGRDFEVQPRLAVELRDATALAARVLAAA